MGSKSTKTLWDIAVRLAKDKDWQLQPKPIDQFFDKHRSIYDFSPLAKDMYLMAEKSRVLRVQKNKQPSKSQGYTLTCVKAEKKKRRWEYLSLARVKDFTIVAWRGFTSSMQEAVHNINTSEDYSDPGRLDDLTIYCNPAVAESINARLQENQFDKDTFHHYNTRGEGVITVDLWREQLPYEKVYDLVCIALREDLNHKK
jgi:hypothetical protein